ncbi:hypothetical protein BGZ49_002331, partial [Haplosporangium sp. Z 27]
MATLKQMLHPALLSGFDGTPSEYERIISIAEDRQRAMTIMTEEVASGELYNSSYGTIVSKTFDIRDIFPSKFELRAGPMESKLRVASLPTNLQEHLAASIGKQGGAITGLLSQGFLQYLYSRFLGIQSGVIPTVDNDQSKHPIWDNVCQLIRSQSNTNDLPKLLYGLSLTTNERLRQLST